MKTIRILYLIIYTLIISCETKQDIKESEKVKNEKGFSEMSTKEKIEDVERDIVPTDKNIDNEQWIKNLYRNNKYQCRIVFPKEWEFDNGTTKSTIARALNREKGIAISLSVTEYKKAPKDFSKYDIKEFESDFRELFTLQNLNPRDVKFQTGSLNNFPAHILEMVTLQSSGIKSYDFLSKQIHCYMNSKLYVVGINLPLDEWNNETSKIFDRVVESFNFELAY